MGGPRQVGQTARDRKRETAPWGGHNFRAPHSLRGHPKFKGDAKGVPPHFFFPGFKETDPKRAGFWTLWGFPLYFPFGGNRGLGGFKGERGGQRKNGTEISFLGAHITNFGSCANFKGAGVLLALQSPFCNPVATFSPTQIFGSPAGIWWGALCGIPHPGYRGQGGAPTKGG